MLKENNRQENYVARKMIIFMFEKFPYLPIRHKRCKL